jgi:hypothetical protein
MGHRTKVIWASAAVKPTLGSRTDREPRGAAVCWGLPSMAARPDAESYTSRKES